MPTYEERARALWQSLSPADKQRIHGFLMIDGNASWKFNAEKVADLCESRPKIPFALRAMVATDKRKAGPNESSDDCLARASEVLRHAEVVARTVSNCFGEVVTEDAYRDIHFRLIQAGRRKGWKAVPVATIMQTIDLYAFNTTITPPDPDEALDDETREENLRLLWERAKLWSAPRDCSRLQNLLNTIEKELPAVMRPKIKEDGNLVEEADTLVADLKRDLENGRRNADHISRQLEEATSTNEIIYFENKLSKWDRKRRHLCENLKVQEAKAKYLRWGGRPLGRFDPFDDIQQAILKCRQTDGDIATPQD
ncbi:hypothetical protein LA080_009939 [Diaporthe eres]|uniref:Uncharacterized protein n=1 Tax=Diaporthe vaccinii TaxID=105482 RepID=A0ABR4E429_9PEZI|nr:hypothetical protein LA080_009939 [Diaporthe eres]